MKKEAKVEYGIAIVKPWSKEMYDHNDEVAEAAKDAINALWQGAMINMATEYDEYDELLEADWSDATEEMIRIQKAVTCFGFGFGYTVHMVSSQVEDAIDDAPYYRLNDIVEELEIELEKGFVGFN